MTTPKKRVGLSAKQKSLVDLVSQGVPPETAIAQLQVKPATWANWRSRANNPAFMPAFEAAYQWGKTHKAAPPDFVTFRKKFLGLDTPPHQQTWIKHLINCTCKQLLILTPPEAGKTTMIGRDLPAWIFATEGAAYSRGEHPEPNRIAYVSGTSKFAWDVGWQLQRLLTDKGDFEALWKTFGPFKEEARQRWSQQSVYMAWRDAAEKEPSIQWLGYANQIQGKRLTLAILDDVDSATMGATDRASILRILYRVILQRLGSEGKLIMIGNRQDDNDIYSQILSSAPEAGWHVVVQQATNSEGEPFWDRFTADYFQKKRAMVGEREYNLVYQQRSTPGPSALFRRPDLDQCRVPDLKTGEKFDGGLTVASLDPAVEGPWASFVVSLSPSRDKLRLIDLKVGKGGGYEAMRDAIRWSLEYAPHYMAIEKQGGLSLFVGPEIRKMISDRNASLELVPTTSQGLMDSYYGLSALALWFNQQKIEVPWSMGAAQRFRPLLDELEFYQPDSKAPKDRVMALWFAWKVALSRAPLLLPAFGDASQRYPWLQAQQRSIRLDMEDSSKHV